MVGNGSIIEESVHDILDFGGVPIGTSVAKTFQVKNLSSVEAKFTVGQKVTGTVAMDKVFVCKKKEYFIKPNASVNVKVGTGLFAGVTAVQ